MFNLRMTNETCSNAKTVHMREVHCANHHQNVILTVSTSQGSFNLGDVIPNALKMADDKSGEKAVRRIQHWGYDEKIFFG